MGIKKRTKVSAEFSMSSLTDIIFLLLIFFMLTSSLVSPNSLNLRLPGTSTNKKVDDLDKVDDVRVRSGARFYFNGVAMSASDLESRLTSKSKGKGDKYNITLSPDDDATNEDVVVVMDMALRLGINAILSAE